MGSVKTLSIAELNTSSLSEEEKKLLLRILANNNQIVNHENNRLNRLNKEIQSQSDSLQKKQQSSHGEICLTCNKSMFDFDGCEKCLKNHCEKCCLKFGPHEILLCKVCYKEFLLEAKSARWFYDRNKATYNAADNKDTIERNITSQDYSAAEPISVGPLHGEEYQNAVEEMAAKMLEYDVAMSSQLKSRVGTKRSVVTVNAKDQITSTASTAPKEADFANNKDIALLVEKLLELNRLYEKSKN